MLVSLPLMTFYTLLDKNVHHACEFAELIKQRQIEDNTVVFCSLIRPARTFKRQQAKSKSEFRRLFTFLSKMKIHQIISGSRIGKRRLDIYLLLYHN